MTNCQIVDIKPSQPSRDGDGVAIKRVVLMNEPRTDPVLLIDELRSPYREDFAGGFPPHPHRGMQTLTYMIDGGIIHEDSMGNRGEIRGGGAQWMSAGRGVIHSEMPTQDTHGLHGFQLWFNLPAAQKMAPPRYRDISRNGLGHLESEHFVVRAIAGEWLLNGESVQGPLDELVPQASLIDLTIYANATVSVDIGLGDSVLGYVYDGSLSCDGHSVTAGHLAIANHGDQWNLMAGAEDARLLVMTGRPIGEPVVGYGPFVMNTREQIEQAIRDYQAGTFIQGS